METKTGGVKAFSIQGRMYRERERLHGAGMTPADRAWRAQWLKDQHLSHNEPVHVPEIRMKLMNPIRRFYRTPMDAVERALTPKLGADGAYLFRGFTAKMGFIVATIYAAAYYFKYNANDWTRKGGWRVTASRKCVVPGEPGYPYVRDRTVGADYASRGFKNSPI